MKTDYIEKSTLSADENDILKMSAKIQQNESENKVYQKQLDKFFRGEMPTNEVINVCSTPNILKLLNSTARKVVLNQSELVNSLSDKNNGHKNHSGGHEIDKVEMYKLSEAIRNPILVLTGNAKNQNSVLLITDMVNKNNENVFVPISLDRQNGKISNISTLYGKKNLSHYLSEHLSKIIAINTKKADMLADKENQYFQSINDTVIRFDNSIAYTMKNVKYPEPDLKINCEKSDGVYDERGESKMTTSQQDDALHQMTAEQEEIEEPEL